MSMRSRQRAYPGWAAIMVTLICLVAGCEAPKPTGVALNPQRAAAAAVENDSMAKRFQQPGQESKTAVESVMEISKQYTAMAEQAAELKQQNQQLTTENGDLKTQLTAAQGQLQQTQKELTEANDLLIEMRIELNNWKTDILGFRKEIREADRAQLQALLKILRVLGGEAKESPSTPKPASLVAPPPPIISPPSQDATDSGNTGDAHG